MEALARHRVGLLLFAGRTYPLSPPATDKDAIRFFLGGIDPGLVNENDEGTSLAGALEGALALLEAREAPTGGRAIVIVSDGDSPAEDRGALLDAARGMARRGVRVFTIGVGSEQGAGLSRPNLAGRWGGPILASDGRPVVSRLERELLAEVASRGGGRYADASAPLEMRAALGALAALADDGGPRAGRYAGLGPVFWLALVALLLLLPRGGGRPLRATDESAGWPR
jgi:Ca-activated chloride channel family protein